MTPPVIELTKVSRTYGTAPAIAALRDIDLTIETGEMVAIVGPSGSGKSTLLNIMGTLDRPTSGRVSLSGSDTADLSDRQLTGLRAARLGFVFQGFHLLEHFTVLENVATGLLYRGVRAATRAERAHAALDAVGLGDRADTRPTKLSGGQRQRVAIARAIVAQPDLVLADEPTGNLDSKTGAEILTLLEGLNRRGATIAVITHDQVLAKRFRRQIHLLDGQITSDTRVEPFQGTPNS